MLCPLWDPILFTTVEYVLSKVSRKVYDYKELLMLNIKTLNHEDSFQCVNVQRVHSSEILLTYYGWCWGTSAFLIRYGQLCSLAGVTFRTDARYCRVGFAWRFCHFVVIRCFVLCFSSLVVCLVLYRGCDYFLLGVDVFATVFVNCVVTSVRLLG